MKKVFNLLLLVFIFDYGCQKPATDTNPFFSEWNTPFGVPPFDEIKNEHYLDAFQEGIRQENAEIQAIVNNPDAPTFENTILPLDRSGELLTKVTRVFFALDGAHTNDEMQALSREISPLLSSHRDNISMNDNLFARVKRVYDNMDASGLDHSQKRVVEKIHQAFTRNGADLDANGKEKLRKYNEELTSLIVQFGQNQLAETNHSFKLIIDNKDDLAGLPDNIISRASEAANAEGLEGKWMFTLHKPSWIPFLQYSQKRELREKLYRGWYMIGNNDNEYDNKEILRKIVELRVDRAQLLGYDDHASYVLEVNMAQTPENVYDFLFRLWEPALEISKREVQEMQAIIDAENGNFKLASWDWWYYAEKLRKQKYDLDENELTPYFKLENVRDGMFWVANQLFGITFHKLENIPVYHHEVEVFEAKEADGAHIGLLYLDYFPRESKRGGAWCGSFRRASDKDEERIYPISTIVCNFTKPTGNVPSLLTWDEVTTLFHEFGHALHGLFTKGQYQTTAGVVQRDFVELPSQIMENWAAEPEVLKYYGKHFETGETISDELIEKIHNSKYFNKGFETVEYLAAAILDLDFHTLKPGEKIHDVLAFEKRSMEQIGLIEEIIPRYRSTYFAHIFNYGYDAGYYVYIWAAVLDADAFDAFKQTGDIFNQELAAKFRKYCLSKNGEDEGMVQYRKFRGKDPSVEPLLINRGLKEATVVAVD
jgi:peptidyl-dipeptidase Dcp